MVAHIKWVLSAHYTNFEWRTIAGIVNLNFFCVGLFIMVTCIVCDTIIFIVKHIFFFQNVGFIGVCVTLCECVSAFFYYSTLRSKQDVIDSDQLLYCSPQTLTTTVDRKIELISVVSFSSSLQCFLARKLAVVGSG